MRISEKCHIIPLTGGKGGLGKSLIAANLALAAQKEFKIPVLLIDLDSRSCGDQNVILGMRSKLNVEQLGSFKQALNQSALSSVLAYHPSGMAYLSAVTGPDQRLSCELSLFKKQLSSLSQFFSYIFVDLGSDIGPLQSLVLDSASAVLLVAAPEILALNQSKRILGELSHLPSALFYLAVNRVGSSGLNASVVSRALGRPILASFPEENLVAESLHSSKPYVVSSPQSASAKSCHELIRKLNSGILEKGKQMGRSAAPKPAAAAAPPPGSAPEPAGVLPGKGKKDLDPMTLLKMQIHSELIKEMDLKKDLTKAKDESSKQELRSKTKTVISRLVDLRGGDLTREKRSQIIKQVLDESLGLGVLEELLSDKAVSEIMINGCDQIYCEKNGRLQLSPHTVTSNLHLRNIVERIVSPLGRRIDEKVPYVDARLADGSRVNAIIEPLAMDGPAITIRKFPTEQIKMDDLVVRFKSITKEMAGFLKICVEQGMNVIISGGTGSGKTTFLNVLSSFIPGGERIITVEDAAELQLKQDHVVRLETRPANIEGEGAVTIRDLIKNSLRMRPDRIVVGECRDGAALDMLSAMNTGHDGSLTTVHANNAREAVARLETLCLMAGMDLPAKAIREQIAGAVNLIVQIGRMSDGSRKVKSVTEVVGMQGDVVTLQEVFRFKEEGFTKEGKIIGQFQASGIIPGFVEKFEQRGVKIPRDLFTTKKTQSMEPSPPSGPAKGGLKRPAIRRPAGLIRPAAGAAAAAGQKPRMGQPPARPPGLAKPGQLIKRGA